MAGPGDPAVSDTLQNDDAAVDIWENETKELLTKGEDLMTQELYKKGIAVIMDAVNMCRCNPSGNGKARHGKDKSCHNAQCITAVRSKDHNALYQVASSPCTCGYKWPSCSQPLHLRALDALAKCLEKADQHVSALSTAFSIIRLDPASAAGYCRAAKILRYLQKNCRRSDPSVNASLQVILRHANLPSVDMLQDVIKCFIKHGLYNSEQHRQGPTDTYYLLLCRMAHTLKLEEALRDPVKKLPREVLTMMFSRLRLGHRISCLRVNKQWYQLVMQDSGLWADLVLENPRDPLRFFSIFLQKHQHIKSLTIRNMSKFYLSTVKLNHIFYGLPHLKRLDLGPSKRAVSSGPPYSTSPHTPFGVPGRAGASLTHLSLDFSFDPDIARLLIGFTRDTLEELDLKNTTGVANNIIGSRPFPKLKKLRITSANNSPPLPVLQMEPLVRATPNLEQLYLDGFMVIWHQTPNTPLASKEGLWPELRGIVLGPAVSCPPMDAPPPVQGRILPPFNPNMRSIEILGSGPLVAHHVLFNGDPPPRRASDVAWSFAPYGYPHLPNLEVFRCMTAIEPQHLQPVLEPAAKSGSLQVLELTIETTLASPPDTRLRQLLGNTKIDYPAGDFAFANSPNIHTLGLHNFNWPFDYGSPTIGPGLDGQPLLDWLDYFPKLHTVSAYPGWHAGAALVIKNLVTHPRIKVLHQDSLRHAADYEPIAKLAAKHGVELHQTRKYYPPQGWAKMLVG